MQLRGLDVEDATEAIRSLTASLLREEGHRVALVEQTQLAARRLRGGGVDVDASLDHVTMEVGHQRTDVARGVGPILLLPLAVLDVVLHALGELDVVALVDGVDLAVFGEAHVGVGEVVAAQRGVEGEAVDAVAGGVDQHGGRAVDDVSSGHLVRPLLQEVLQLHGGAGGGDTAIDGEDRPHGHVHVDV